MTVDMAKFLLNSERFSEKLLNHPVSMVDRWSTELATFWERWQCIEPDNRVYTDHANELDHCIPCMLHGDEGTGHRRKPVLQVSWGSLLRIGKGPLERMFLITSCSHKRYSRFNKGTEAGNVVIDKLLGEIAKSAVQAFADGIETGSGHIFFLVFVGLAGDHPFQTKAYQATRSHLKVDICPRCHANTYSVPFEDVSKNAMWRSSIFQSLPWNRRVSPPLGLIPGAQHPAFIRGDLMHMIPHGCARTFAASIICMMAGPLDIFWPPRVEGKSQNSKEDRLEEAYDHFESWLEANGEYARDMKEFTLENLGWKQNGSFPDMTCKASDCNLLIRWLIDFLTTTTSPDSWPLQTALAGLKAVDEFMRLSYTGDRIFWDRQKQHRGKRCIGMYLHSYVQLQRYWHNRGWTLFKIVPKLHYTARWHDALSHDLADHKDWSLSPGTFSTPILEDFIGVVQGREDIPPQQCS